jgi:hypothetical protein
MSEKQPTTIETKIDISDIDANEAQKINDQFSNNPKETIKNLQQIIDGSDKTKKKELAAKIIQGISTCKTDNGNDFDTIQNINQFLTLLNNLKSLDPNIEKVDEKNHENTYSELKTKYSELKTELEDKKKELEKKQNKEEELKK